MRLYCAAVLVAAMMGFACELNTSSSGGGGSQPTTGYDTVLVYNCSDYAMNVFSRPSNGGAWSQHGSSGTNLNPNGSCNESAALTNGVSVDLGNSGRLVRAVLWNFNTNCDSNDPDGMCLKRDAIFAGDDDGASTEFKVSTP